MTVARIVEAGHVYDVPNSDGPGAQRVEFVRRRDGAGEPTTNRAPGILCQGLLRVLIDRVLYLYAEAPCEEDTAIVRNLRECLVLFETRAARRSIEKLSKPEEARVCSVCDHILCFHDEAGG